MTRRRDTHDEGRGGSRVARRAMAGLGVVLASFAVVAVGGAVLGSGAADQVRRSGDIAEQYMRVLDALATEDAVEASYGEAPSVPARFAFERAVERGGDALREIERLGTPADREVVRAARPLHDSYTAAVRMMFAAVQRGDMAEADRIDDEIGDPAQDALQPLISNAAPQRAIGTLDEVEDLDRTLARARNATVAVVIAGTVVWMLLMMGWAVHRRRAERAALARLADSRAQAQTDELTGLANRRGLYAAAESALDEARDTERSVALAFIDLDRFKEINDTLGHGVGDDLLRQVGGRLSAAFPDALALGRLGGDEYVAVISGPRAPRTALRSAEAFLAGLDEPFPLEGLLVNVRASAGIAVFPEDGRDRSELMRHADAAMYRAKAAGGGVEVHAGHDDGTSVERLVLASELRGALGTGQIIVHYQPQADLVTGAVTAVEALVRWQHPSRGLLPPAAFLPIAEQQGMMRAVTLHVMRLALEQAGRWQEARRPLAVAVNLSAANLLDARFPDDVAALLREADVPPELLKLEITEDTIMTDPVLVLDVLARLGEMGLGFSLDDFGTGYSSLSYLKRLPVQELKIDRSFVMQMDSDADDRAIVRSTIDLARSLGLRVVAEGVESRVAWEQLKAFGCDVAQGYHLARPLPVAELDDWLAGRQPALAERRGES